jgi:Macrocin-O-methyltransferase (TylF)
MTVMSDFARRCLVGAGSLCESRTISRLDVALNYLAAGQWMHNHASKDLCRFRWWGELFEWAADRLRERQVLYLEFGVFQGKTLALWSRLLRNPSSRLHGFDSFEGLPEEWSPGFPKGHFTMNGVPPEIDDPRVRFYKGWFDVTLPAYRPPPHEELFINIDADLYSSIRTVLKHLKPHLRVGSYLYFDDFHHREHAMKAYREFLLDSGYQFEMLAATDLCKEVLFRRTR